MHRSKSPHVDLAAKAANFVHNGFGGSRPYPLEADLPSREEIAKAAYLLAEARGFRPGRELDDWLIAERELKSRHGSVHDS